MIDVLLPYRPANVSRIRGWTVCLHAWDFVKHPVRLHPGGDASLTRTWSKAKAVNRLAERAGEKILLYGSDHLPPTDEKLDEIDDALEHFAWVGCFNQHATLSDQAMRKVWRDMRADRWPRRLTGADADAVAPFAIGVIAVRRDAWERVGGLDERFVGWGGEDIAIREALRALYGDWSLRGRVWSTPHVAASRVHAEDNMAIVGEYRAAINENRLQQYLDETVEARRGQIPAS